MASANHTLTGWALLAVGVLATLSGWAILAQPAPNDAAVQAVTETAGRAARGTDRSNDLEAAYEPIPDVLSVDTTLPRARRPDVVSAASRRPR